MAVNVYETISINKSRHEVAGYAMEPENDPIWIGGISEALLLTDRPIGLGTRVKRVASFLNKKINYILEVKEFTSAQLMVMKSVEGPFPMKVTYQFDDNDNNEGTRASIRIEGDASGFFKITEFLMIPQIRRNIKGDLKRLKTILETSD